MPQKLVNSMVEEQRTARQVVHQRVSQKEGSPHYVLLYSEEEGSTDEDNVPLRAISRSTSTPRKIEVINIQVKPEDTLQALALRYRCTISELKRINKIHKENEIYAKPYIKVPIQPFSILTETLAKTQKHTIDTPMQYEEANVRKEEQLTDVVTTLIETESSQTEINTIILNSVCEPLSSYNNINSLEVPCTEHDQLLGSTESTDIIDSHETDLFKCSGDDWGLSWAQLLGFSLLLGCAGPIIYILCTAEYPFKTNITVSN